MQTNKPNLLFYRPASSFKIILISFTLLLVFSCQKQAEELKEETQIINQVDVISKTIKQEDFKELKLLLSLPNFSDSLKGALNLNYYKYDLKADGTHLWSIGLKKGSFGLDNAKALISLQKKQLSVLILSYEYDEESYIRGNFNTYTGIIGFYDGNINKAKDLYFEKGVLESVITSGFTTLSLCGNCPPPAEVNWCLEFPTLCSGSGGGGEIPPYEGFEPVGDSGGTSYSSTVNYLITTLSLPQAQANWLASNSSLADEMYNFLNYGNYTQLTFEDKKRIAYDHLFNMMANPDYLAMVQDYSASVAAAHPWMIELFKELAIEIGFKIVKKYVPGYSDWNSVRDAIQNGAQGDWLGLLGEVINIAKKKVPWLVAVDATIDAFNFGTLANKAWKAFDKIRGVL